MYTSNKLCTNCKRERPFEFWYLTFVGMLYICTYCESLSIINRGSERLL
jgi:hypothetical protein